MQSSLNVPDWNGDPGNLPEKEKLFTYKGHTFMWSECDCGKCERPMVYPAGTATPDFGMTVRMRGVDNGNPALNVILKSGVVSVEELAEAFEHGSLIPVVIRVQKLVAEHEQDRESWLESRDISQYEIWHFEHAQFS
jgi:hypothetical protein